MSLFDAFKPKWQNSNPAKRLEAVAELGADNQDVLERIAGSDSDASVRMAAVKKLTIIPSLLKVSKDDADDDVNVLRKHVIWKKLSRNSKMRLNRVPRICLI